MCIMLNYNFGIVCFFFQGLIVDQTIEKVSFCAPDRNHEKGFAYICRDGTTRRWMCHGFLAIKESVSVSVTCFLFLLSAFRVLWIRQCVCTHRNPWWTFSTEEKSLNLILENSVFVNVWCVDCVCRCMQLMLWFYVFIIVLGICSCYSPWDTLMGNSVA